MKIPTYNTPPGTICPSCGQECLIVPLLNDFDYSGTHCTNGRGGVEYPADWGCPVSDCCEEYMTDAVKDEIDFDWGEYGY